MTRLKDQERPMAEPVATERRALQRQVGFAMWKVDAVRAGRKFDRSQPREAVREAWKADAKDYMRAATLLMRQLENQGVTLSSKAGGSPTDAAA
jgi:hypothetical protein